MAPKSPEELQEHMVGTYFGLRIGLAAIGFLLPVVLLIAGRTFEGSISAYYHTPPWFPFFTTRDLFVGGLLAAGACLYLYKGFSNRENVALNLAGVFAVLVALLPTAATPSDLGLVSKLHGTSAVLLFVCIAYVSLSRSRDTLCLLPEKSQQKRYARLYVWSGLAMIASPLVAVVLSYTLEPATRFRTLIFWVETFGVWTFGAYWLIKTSEMRKTEAERLALDAKLKREPVPPPQEAPADQPGRGFSRILRKLSPESGEVERVAWAYLPEAEPVPYAERHVGDAA